MKSMAGVRLSEELKEATNIFTALAGSLTNLVHAIACINQSLSPSFLKATAPIIGMPTNVKSFHEWAATKPSRYGSDYNDRFDFWAEDKDRLEGVAFYTRNHGVVVPVWRDGDRVICIGKAATYVTANITTLAPLFPKAIRTIASDRQYKEFCAHQRVVANMAKARKGWMAGNGTYADMSDPWAIKMTEAISDLDEVANTHSHIRDAMMYGGRKTGKVEAQRRQDRKIREFAQMYGASSARLDDMYTNDHKIKSNLCNETHLKPEFKEEKKDMKTQFVDTQKEVLTEVAALQAGRASNKVIKEAVRPLLKAFFKPTFMQKLGMKLFGIQDPTEKFLKSDASDFACAQLANLVLDIRNVQDEKVRKVAKAGIVYSGNKLADNIPLEEAMDQVVKHLTQGADKIADKLTK